MEALRPDDPSRVGEYRLAARLGEGGMGVVYLGRSPGGRMVAVKVVRERFASDPEYRARFRREVATAQTVTGAFTAPVLDADAEAPAPWLVTGYLPGLTLREAVTTCGPLPPEALRVFAAGVLEALVDIHRAGLAHRDLKPGNIVLTAGGPRVIDFGVARPQDGTAITIVGTVVGTPGYMSPEQAAGGVTGPASDIFSLGAVLVFAATGREPFGTGPLAETLQRVQEARADLTGITERWLRELIETCLRREPDRRPSADKLLNRLSRPTAAPGEPWLPPQLAEAVERRDEEAREAPTIPAAQLGAETIEPGQPVVAARKVRRRSLIIVGAAAAAAATGAVVLVRSNRSAPSAQPQPPARNTTTSTTSRTPTSTPPAPPPLATLRWKTKVSDYYPKVYTAGGAVVAVGDERTMQSLDAQTGASLWKKPANTVSEVIDGLAYIDHTQQFWVVATDPVSGATRWTYKAPFADLPVHRVVAGGLIFVGHVKIRALDIATGRIRWTSGVPAQYGLAAGAGIVVATGETGLVALDAASGKTRWTYSVGDRFYNLVVADGMVVFSDPAGALMALRADTGAPAWRQELTVTWMSAGPGSLYLSSFSGEVRAMATATGQPRWSRRRKATESPNPSDSPALSVVGDTVYAGGSDATVYAMSATDGRILWTYGADMKARTAPVSAAGLVFVGTREGNVEAIAPPPGEPRAGT